MMTFKDLDEYYDRFGDIFPLSEMKGYTEEQQGEILQECLDKDKPYEKLYNPDYNLHY